MGSSKMNCLLLVLGTLFAFCDSQAIPEFCQLSSEAGEGTEFIFALYYDTAQDLCNPFIYKGQGGNENRFYNERECIRNCSSNAENVYPIDERDACHFKKSSGKCSGQNLRFYYDSIRDKCKKFQWTGCIGNGNRFTTMEHCNMTCAGIHNDSHEEEEEEADHDTPVGIILGILLGITVVAILITVIVFTVKSVKKSKAKKEGKKREEKTEVPLREQSIEMS